MKVFGMKALPGLAVCGLMLGGCRSYEQRAIDWAAEAQKEAPGEVRITIGALSAGSEFPQLKLAVLTEGQLLAVAKKKQKLRKKLRKRSQKS